MSGPAIDPYAIEQQAIEQIKTVWFRIFAGSAVNGTTETFKFCLASADNMVTYTGDARQALYVWGAGETSGYPPPRYVVRSSSTAATAYGYTYSAIPWKVNKTFTSALGATFPKRIDKGFGNPVNATLTLLFDGSESVAGSCTEIPCGCGTLR